MVKLVPKAFDVLLVLIQNNGRLVEKQELLDTVWAGVTVEENSLTRAVADIRKALGESGRKKGFIETVSKGGYRFAGVVTSPALLNQARDTALQTLAVLPFSWLTEEGSDRSLAVGLADALITRLSNLPQIIVRPTSSILHYAEGGQDPIAIARQLRVDFVVGGSLQQSGDLVRVTVQMVSPDQERSVWADQFEETFTHIFSVEDSISERVAAALALKLTSSQKDSLARPSTENQQAYELYLRGRSLWSKQTFLAAQKAIACFRQAIDLDAGYALAWAGIADAHILIGLSGALSGGAPPDQVYPEARYAALRAIELHGGLADAHTSLGFINAFYAWDFDEAQREFQLALALQPNYAGAHHGYALALGFSGRHQPALMEIDAALEVEPSSAILNANKGYLLYISGRYEEAAEHLLKALELDPAFAPTHYRLGLVYAERGMQDEAILHLQEAQRLSGDGPYALAALGYVYARTGRERLAREILSQLTESAETRYVSAVLMAEVCAGLGRSDDAVGWLTRAVEERTPALFPFCSDPRFKGIRSMSACRRVLEQMKRSVAAAN